MVLDNDLGFAFEPVKTGKYPSRVVAIPFSTDETGEYLVLFDYFGTDSTGSMFYLYDEAGNRTREHATGSFENSFGYIFTNGSDDGKSFYFLKNHSALVELLDGDFNTLDSYILPPLAQCKPIARVDADLDGDEEYFFLGRGINALVISGSDFRSAINLSLDFEGTNFLISPVLDLGEKPLVNIQLERHSWLIRYERNPLFYLRWPLYMGLYIIIYLFISLLYRTQKYRLELKRATEKELASLQMKAIRNQIEPHFTLNVLNSIGGLYLTEENRQQADYIFGRYASLIRQTVITSDKIIIPLEDELEFVRNYIDIERFRAGNSFDYIVDIDPGVDTGISIPRMLVFTFAENSVKHGIRKKPEGGILEISVRLNGGNVIVTVEDNGPGFVRDAASPAGTGRGLKIVNELTDLFHRLEKVRITWSVENRNDHNPSVTGTTVIITIPVSS
jgi:signal transduction histidine kinase